MAKLTLTQGDDWRGVYIDGKLDYEGHDIPAFVFIDYLNDSRITEAEEKWVDIDWMYEQGHLPENLEDVKIDH